MKTTVYFLVAFLVVLGLILSACSSPAPSSTTSTAPKTTAPVPTSSAAPTTSTASPTSTTGITSLIPATDKPQYGGVFRFASPASPTKLVTWNQSYDGRFLKACFDTLLRIDENGQLQPWLATSWKVADDLKDKASVARLATSKSIGDPFWTTCSNWFRTLLLSASTSIPDADFSASGLTLAFKYGSV